MIQKSEIVAVGPTADSGRTVYLTDGRSAFVPNDLHNADFHTVNEWQEDQARERSNRLPLPDAPLSEVGPTFGEMLERAPAPAAQEGGNAAAPDNATNTNPASQEPAPAAQEGGDQTS